MFPAKAPDRNYLYENWIWVWPNVFLMFQADTNEAPSPLNKKGCCSTRCENKCCTDIFKKKSVFMMLIYEKRERRRERTVLLLLLFNTVSDDNVIILKSTIYRDVFHSRKSLYASLWNVTVLFTWYNITLCLCHWCSCHCFVLFFFSLYGKKKSFISNTASVIFAVSDPEQNKKGIKEVKKNGKAVRP